MHNGGINRQRPEMMTRVRFQIPYLEDGREGQEIRRQVAMGAARSIFIGDHARQVELKDPGFRSKRRSQPFADEAVLLATHTAAAEDK